jgi:hypothetical protein
MGNACMPVKQAESINVAVVCRRVIKYYLSNLSVTIQESITKHDKLITDLNKKLKDCLDPPKLLIVAAIAQRIIAEHDDQHKREKLVKMITAKNKELQAEIVAEQKKAPNPEYAKTQATINPMTEIETLTLNHIKPIEKQVPLETDPLTFLAEIENLLMKKPEDRFLYAQDLCKKAQGPELPGNLLRPDLELHETAYKLLWDAYDLQISNLQKLIKGFEDTIADCVKSRQHPSPDDDAQQIALISMRAEVMWKTLQEELTMQRAALVKKQKEVSNLQFQTMNVDYGQACLVLKSPPVDIVANPFKDQLLTNNGYLTLLNETVKKFVANIFEEPTRDEAEHLPPERSNAEDEEESENHEPLAERTPKRTDWHRRRETPRSRRVPWNSRARRPR